MNTCEVLSICEHPELADAAAHWFHEKWGIAQAAYAKSIDECISCTAPVPQWYVAVTQGRIVGGLGVIENDFHNRPDLSPNVCAVYVDKCFRCKGLAGLLLETACCDMRRRGVDNLYLLTDHTSFYERYGWEFLCMVQGDGEPQPSRMYIHREVCL